MDGASRLLLRLPAGEHDDPAARGLELTPTHVVWWNGDSIWAVPRAGGKPQRIGRAAETYQTVGGFVTDGTRVYYLRSAKIRGTETWRGEIWSASITSGAGKRVAELPRAAGDLAISGDTLYFAVGASVRRSTTGGARAGRWSRTRGAITDRGVGRARVLRARGAIKQDRAVVTGLTRLDGLSGGAFYQARGHLVAIPVAGGSRKTLETDSSGCAACGRVGPGSIPGQRHISRLPR